MDALSCLAPPAALLPFADAAIARALHLSISSVDSGASSSSSLSAPPPAYCYAPPPPSHVTTTTTTCCDSSVQLVADSPTPGRRHHKQQLAPAGGRAGKRRSRASKRTPTTYISTDPANFRIMVQQITGVQADIDDILQPAAIGAAAAAVLMAADTTVGAGYGGNPLQLPMAVPGGDPEALLHQQQPCFPTLDSWNVMYERSDQLL